MEENDILSIISIIIAVVTALLGIINHKRIRSRCNDTEIVASIDVENTTPPKEQLSLKIPATPRVPEPLNIPKTPKPPKTIIQLLEEERREKELPLV